MTTLPYRRQQVTPRSGGRIAGDRRTAAYQDFEYATAGSTALAPARRSTALAPARRARENAAPRLRVAPPAPVTTARAPFVTVLLVVVIAGVFGILALNTAINTNAFKLQDLHDQGTRLNRQEQQLTGELAERESPNSLAAACRRLGCVPAGTPAYITLPDGKVLGVPVPADGQQSTSGAGKPGTAQPRR